MSKSRQLTKKIFATATIAMFVIAAIACITSDSDADTTIRVKDGLGTEIALSSPASHVMTLGKGTTATVIQLDCLDKIVVCDSYSLGSESVFKDLKQRVSDKKIFADGNGFSKQAEYRTNAIDAADTAKGGVFDKEKDVIVITLSQSYATGFVSDLRDLGFKNIMVWYSIDSYDQLVDFAKNISKALTGEVKGIVNQMENVPKVISDTLREKGITDDKKTRSFFVTYSGSAYKVGNTGSVAVSMIQAAGGKVTTIDDSKAKPTYETSIPELAEPGIVVFEDYSIAENPERADKIASWVGDSAKKVGLQSLWNNYSIDSMNGVWTMACAMYPDYFHGDVPEVKGGSTNPALYIGIGVAAVAVIGVGMFFFLRK